MANARRRTGRLGALPMTGKQVAVMLLSGLVWCGGCNSPTATQPVRLIAARPFESDIPVPSGFVLVDSASEDRSTGVSRLYLRHLYEGQADKHSVRLFYRAQMPLARWVKVSDGSVKGEITMRFEKAAESCTLLIADSNDRMGGRTHVRVIVAREERGQVPPTARSGK